MLFLVVAGLVVSGLWLVTRAARRFAAEQRRVGRWDANGPLVETESPGGNHGMSERLEIVGDWHGAIRRDHRHDADIAEPPETDQRTPPGHPHR